MTRQSTARFPELERVFSGYLNEDFAVEYGSPEAALRAYRDDAAPLEWRRFQREAKKLSALATAREFDEILKLLHDLGSRWTPRSREELIGVLETGTKDDARRKT